MFFNERLKELEISVEEIEAIGYSKRAAYSWLDGSRRPKAMIQDSIIRMILEGRREHDSTS